MGIEDSILNCGSCLRIAELEHKPVKALKKNSELERELAKALKKISELKRKLAQHDNAHTPSSKKVTVRPHEAKSLNLNRNYSAIHVPCSKHI